MEEWDDLLYPHIYDSFVNPTPPQLDENHNVWSFEENKEFEDALAELDHSCPNFFENLASRVPFKTIEQVKSHYQDLIDDIDMIESGLIEPPEYNDGQGVEKGHESSSKQQIGTTASQNSKRGVPWSEDEHRLFLIGLKKFGKGDWRSISRYCVLTRTPTQIASHAQKYFRRLQTTVPPERRRNSIHDTQLITTTTPAAPTTAITASDPPLECANLERVEKPLPPPNSVHFNNMMTNSISSSSDQETHPFLNYRTSTFPPPTTTANATSASAFSTAEATATTQSSNGASSSFSFASPTNWFSRT